ncbi:non-ribosomal peptide synthetase [Pseudomonas poae]|uniref:Non-ribosomal peptide synthetase n=1 Tax=Pseudomonas poae TaxID=200451 RepID=A0A2S9EGC2_9PSED|nr:non-ribosomal peptide synthetase [Pseudomonas poae]PRA33148.1 non-ribosomal peptide synthetase [Pseudomonas poae]PRC14191.1 non-ribosomal peptide synthetase [Pseudomonas poae]
MQELLASVGSLSSKERKALAALLKRQGINLYNVAPIFKRPAQEPALLSYAQQRLWFFWQMDPHNTAFNIPAALQLHGALNIEALRQSFEALIERHESLRTTFTQEDAQAVQVIHPSGTFELNVEQALGLTDAQQPATINAFVERESDRPFDLEQGPLLRVSLLKLAEDNHVLLVAMHHIVSDGWSVPIMIEELIQFYQGLVRNEPVTLAPLSVQYADFALWQRHWMEAGEQERQLAYWREQLGGEQPVLQLPMDRPRGAVQSQVGADHSITIDPALVTRLKHLVKGENCTLFMLLLASFQALLHRYSGQAQIRVGVPVANRTRAEAERLIGFFVNTLVLKADIDSHMRFRDLLQQVKSTALAGQAHQDLPFEQLLDALQPERSLSYSPMFQVMLNHQYEDANLAPSIEGLRISNLGSDRRTAQYELTLNTVEVADGLSATLSYATDLFDASTIARISRHWVNLLHAVCDDPARAIGDLPLLDDNERHVLLHDFNVSHFKGGHSQFVQQTLEARAEHAPDAIALLFAGHTLTYDALNRRANRLAHHLIALGVGPEVLVGVAVERSMDMIVGLLAILKAGGAYVPMDPEYPRERLAFMIEDSAISLLLTQATLLEVLPIPEGVHTLLLDQESDWLEACSDANPPCRNEAGHLAYMIYTSGSTGRPKAVCVTHGPLSMHCQAIGELYEMSPADCELHFMSFAFDGAHERWLTSLTHGGRLLIRDNTLWSVEQTYAALEAFGVTVAAFPPVYLQQLAEYAEQFSTPPAVRIYCFGGDAVPNASFELVKRVLQPQFIINGYGPTETVVTPLIWKAGREQSCNAAYAPIGKIVGARTAYVLDADLNPVPLGSAGELYLGGEGLARGYYQRPGLTAERFVVDPFSTEGGRLYRSGDLVRLRGDGVTEYLGRVDHQVKIRGYRIELGEIEACLQAHPAVGEAVVVALDGPTGKQLVGYVLPLDLKLDTLTEQDQDLLRTAIRDHLKGSLPDYMLPKHLVLLASLPLTPNGKLDRKALPTPDFSVTQHHYVAPQTEAQQQLVQIWQDVLKLAQVGITDNFFELGGDSIISIQVVSRARLAGLRLTPKDLFQHQTIHSLAAVAQRVEEQTIDQGPVSGASPLTPIQQIFFGIAVPERHHWNQSFLLTPAQPIVPALLAQALTHLVRHHDALRLTFTEQHGHWQASHNDAATAQDVLWQRQADSTEALLEVCNQAQRSLDLQHGPLLRALLVDMANGEQRLLLLVHHLVVDGVSWRILLEDLQSAYQALLEQRAIALAAKTSSFQAWGEQLQRYATDAALHEELGFWQAHLHDAPDGLPGAHADDDLSGVHAQAVSTRLDKTLTRQLLQQAPAAYRTQVNDLLLSALARVICRWTAQPSALIQLEGHGREDLFEHLDLTRTVGWFTSVFPVKLSPGQQMGDSIKAVKEQLRAIPDKGIGYGVLRYLGDESAQQSLRALATARITFNYLGQFDQSFDADALFTPSSEDSGDNQDVHAPLDNWLSINGQVYGGELQLNWTFSERMFDPVQMQQLADEYSAQLQALVEHCLEIEPGVATPSDFPLAKLNQAQLDNLSIDSRQLQDLYPLSPMQQGMLFHAVYEPEVSAYVNQLAVDMEGLDCARFIQAWRSAVERHDILRTAFLWQEGLAQPLQAVHKRLELDVRQLDWRDQPDVQSALLHLASTDRDAGFDLERAPLLRLTLVRIAEQRYHLIYTNHHILMDGWSNSQLMGEILQSYAGQALSPLVGRFAHYIGWLQRQDPALSEQFWRQQLRTLDEPTRLSGCFGRTRQSEAVPGGFDAFEQVLDTQTTQALDFFARQQKVTLNSLVQAAWLILLQRYSKQDTVAFGATVAGRPADLPGVETQLGLFINTLPIIACPQPNHSVASWVAQVQAQNLSLREHEHTALHDIQRWAGLGSQGLFDNILVFENFPVAEALQQAAPGNLVLGEVSDFEQTNYALTVAVSSGARLSLSYEYRLADFDPRTIRRIATHFQHLLLEMIRDPAQALGQLSLVAQEEACELLEQAVGGHVEYPREHCVQQLIEAQVARTPEAVAVVMGDQSLTYQALNTQANRLAHKLRDLGAGPDQLVGLAVERSLDMAIGLLAILKSGAGYVPLDPNYPQDRLDYMLADSGVQLLVIQDALRERLEIAPHIHTLNLHDGLQAYSSANPSPLATAQNLAYVIYTSGSTGQPKGVAIAHAALAEFCRIAADYSQLSADDRVLQFATFSFDGFVEQFYPTLCLGARVVLRDAAVWDTGRFYDEVLRHGITVADLPAAYWHLFALDCAAAGPRTYGNLRQIHVGGEAMSAEGLRHWQAVGMGAVRLLNTYGPTEATVVSSTQVCDTLNLDALSEHGIPIGRPLPGRALHVLDKDFGLATVQNLGELYIGGHAGLARAYHNRPALTAERFLPNPFGQPGERLYRTGDLACRDEIGTVLYAGRADHQVKVRGFRIELGEVEACLQGHEAVREAAVIALDGPTGKQLVGYAVPNDGAVVLGDANAQQSLRSELREYLSSHLPDYMVPSHLSLLSQLPMTPNGKLDRKALPAPAFEQARDFRAPQSELQKQLAKIWEATLGLERVGLDDNFFELGGDSIVSIQLVSRARQEGIRFTPKDLFQHQTILGLSGVAQRSSGLVIDQGPVKGATLLIPIQQAFFEDAIPQRHHWNQSILLKSRETIVPQALDQALQQLLQHHDALRLGFTQQPHGWQAEHLASEEHALLWTREAATAEQLTAYCNQAQRSLNLGNGPLLRALLVTLQDGSQRLLVVVHHLVVDGVSWRILLEDLQAAYHAAKSGQFARLPAKTSSFQAWGERLRGYAQSAQVQQLPYWQQALANAPLDLPCDPLAAQTTPRVCSVSVGLDAQQTRRLLQDAPAAYRTQVNDLLLTALARAVCQWTVQDSTLIQLEGHGREDLFDDIDLTRTLGWFTTTFPVKLTPGQALGDSLKAIKEQLRSIPDRGIGYGALRYLADADSRASLKNLPVPRITFNYLGQLDQSFDEHALFIPAGEDGGDNQDEGAPLENWLNINGQVFAGELKLEWSFSTRHFSEQTIHQLARAYERELVELIEHCTDGRHTAATPSDFPLAQLTQAQLDSLPIDSGHIQDIYPLSPMQQGMLFHTLYTAQNSAYINQMRLDMDGLDPQRFAQAWSTVIARHDILRTAFFWEGELTQPLQVVHKQVQLPLQTLDIRHEANPRSVLDQLAHAELQQGLDPRHAPLMRLVLARTGERAYHLIFTHHHILMDGWSNSQLMGEVVQSYEGVALAPLVGRYRDYVSWLQDQDARADEHFWKQHLPDLEEPTLLARAIHPKVVDAPAGYGMHRHEHAEASARRLEAFAREHKVTANSIVQAAWLLVLQRYTGHATVAFGATVAGRPAQLSGVEQQLGLFINTLPVVATPQATQRVNAWVQQVQSHNLALREHEHVPLYEIQRWANRPGEPLFDSILVFENYPVAEALKQAASGELSFGQVDDHEQTSFALTVAIALKDTLSISFAYDRQQFSDEAIQGLSGHLERLLNSMLEDPQQRLGNLPMLGAVQHHNQIELWNQTDTEYPGEVFVQRLFEEQVRQQPDTTALVFDGQSLSYVELNHRANRLAHHLVSLGVGPDTLVGIAAERSLEMVVGLLAILKAGGAYVPLDPEYPQDRLAYMFEDSGIPLLLTQSHLMAALPIPAQLNCLCLDVPQAWSDQSTANPCPPLAPENLAYVIYTSGSTGRPKGAGNRHVALHNRLMWMQQAYGIDQQDRILQKTPFSFDVSVWEFFWPLMMGARLVLAGVGDHRDPARLVQLITDEQISTLHFVPSMLQAFVSDPRANQCTAPLRIICSGEALPIDLQRQVTAQLPNTTLTNLYGPTEAAIDVTYWACIEEQRDAVPIGQPIANLQTYVLDANLNPLPAGIAGELYLAGIGLARGYHGRPGLTAERFVPSPFVSGALLYRTGDLAHQRPDGVIEYAGRLDHQVKIRGLRIELGEIEARLQEQPAVRESVVVARDVAGSQQLVAYVVPADADVAVSSHSEWLHAIKQTLRAGLPDYMVPAYWVVLDSMPLSPNGKLDRKALPLPETVSASRNRVEPRNAREQQMCAAWEQVLGVDQVSITDNFFELGGHSLLVLQVVSKINGLCDLQLSLHDFMTHPSIEALSDNLALQGTQLSVPLNQNASNHSPLFCFHPNLGMVHSYHPLASALRDQAPVYGIICRAFAQGRWSDIEWQEMINEYVQSIRAVQPNGPYHLAGWSLGGTLALEAAHILETAGEQVAFVGLIDPPPPRTLLAYWEAVEQQERDEQQHAPEADNGLELFSLLFPEHAEAARNVLNAMELGLSSAEREATFMAWARQHVDQGEAVFASLQLGKQEMALGDEISQHMTRLAQAFAYRAINAPLHCWWAQNDKGPAMIETLERTLQDALGKDCLHGSVSLPTDHEGIIHDPRMIQSLVSAFLNATR